MPEQVFVALDLETTGLDARTDAIIEIGAVRFAYDRSAGPFSCRILERFVTFINPHRTIPLRIQQLTGIRDHDVAGAPSLAQVLPELLAFVRADVEAVVAHNAALISAFSRLRVLISTAPPRTPSSYPPFCCLQCPAIVWAN